MLPTHASSAHSNLASPRLIQPTSTRALAPKPCLVEHSLVCHAKASKYLQRSIFLLAEVSTIVACRASTSCTRLMLRSSDSIWITSICIRHTATTSRLRWKKRCSLLQTSFAKAKLCTSVYPSGMPIRSREVQNLRANYMCRLFQINLSTRCSGA